MIKFLTKTTPITFNCRFTYLPPSCYNIQSKPNPIISVTLGTNKSTVCDLHFRLFENVVPRTAQNFKRLLLGTGKYQERNLSLIGTKIDRYIQRNFIQFGNMPQGNCSIFGPTFRDQSFELLHDRPGLLTSISQQNTNNSQFAVTLAPCPFMDLKNVVFGEVAIESFEDFKKLQAVGRGLVNIQILDTKLL